MNTEPETPDIYNELADWARLIEEMGEMPPEQVEIQEDMFSPVTRDLVRGVKS